MLSVFKSSYLQKTFVDTCQSSFFEVLAIYQQQFLSSKKVDWPEFARLLLIYL